MANVSTRAVTLFTYIYINSCAVVTVGARRSHSVFLNFKQLLSSLPSPPPPPPPRPRNAKLAGII